MTATPGSSPGDQASHYTQQLHLYLHIHPRHHLKIYGILGEGCFGQVWKCEALNIDGVKVSFNLTET